MSQFTNIDSNKIKKTATENLVIPKPVKFKEYLSLSVMYQNQIWIVSTSYKTK